MAERASNNTHAVPGVRLPESAPERQERQHGLDHFRAVVALLVAVGSILGAVVVWRASAAFDSSTALRRESERQLLLRRSIVGRIDGWIGQDVQLFTLYQEELHEVQLLRAQADGLEATDAMRADALRDTALDHLAIARSLRQTFRTVRPDLYVAGTAVRFHVECTSTELLSCIDEVRRRLFAGDLNLLALHPYATQRRAHDAQTRSIWLVVIAAGFVFSVLVFTLARAGVHQRRSTAIVGTLIMLASAIAFGFAEWGLR